MNFKTGLAAFGVIAFLGLLTFAGMHLERFGTKFQRETTYQANKQSSMARDGVIAQLTTLNTRYVELEESNPESKALPGIAKQALGQYNNAKHKEDIPEYLVDWIKETNPNAFQ